MTQFSWNSPDLYLKTGKIINCTLFTLQDILVQTKYYLCGHPSQAGWSNLILMHCKRGSSWKLGCAILFMTVQYKKANAVASTNVCLFIKWVTTHKTVLNYLVEIKIFHHRNKEKQRRGEKIGKSLWNSSWKPCFS